MTIDSTKYRCTPYNKGIDYTYIGSYNGFAIFQNDTEFLAEDVCIEIAPHQYLPFENLQTAQRYIDRYLVA